MTDADQAIAAADEAETGRRARAAEARAASLRFLRGNGILLAFIALIALGATQSEHFLTVENFANVDGWDVQRDERSLFAAPAGRTPLPAEEVSATPSNPWNVRLFVTVWF